ncbi:MAG: D-3-phosphoglycerate dehydrogenase / 2-oxoglutarate reductase [Acetobacteraceae bacterium]|jgi:D-3-phosphoglycerate dehydrogenase|nr:D-3-phosphoglycerate dehydrogenase / 2-oxoglutarate reductase [Acetobacteraceae bacterium]
MAINRKRLVFFERWFDPIAEQILDAQDDIELTRLQYADPEQDNWQALASACGYQVAARTELVAPWFGTADLLSRCPLMLALCSAGAGFDVIDVDACNAAGVIVCSQSGTNSEPVAEHAIGLMLALTKRVGSSNRALMRGTATDRFALTGNDIKRKTAGIVGIGQIGRLTAKYCAAFDMRVLAYDPHLSAEQIAERGAMKVDFATLLAESDFISVHCPRNRETLGMFGTAEFAQMKPNAYFINTARGKIHDETALLEALRSGLIAGAGLDVFDVEPPPADHPLLLLDTVIATPHIAGATAEALHAMSRAAAEQWIGLLCGRVPPRLVNPEAWPRYSERFESIIGFRPDPLNDEGRAGG